MTAPLAQSGAAIFGEVMRLRRGWSFCLVALGVCIVRILPAQGVSPRDRHEPVARFEVVSIHSLPSGTQRQSSLRVSPAGDLQAHSAPLISLITAAYDVSDYQVVGSPPWVMSERFDFDAKAGDALSTTGTGPDPKLLLRARLRAMLADRCKLEVDYGVRNQIGFALEVDRKGPRLEAADPRIQDPQTVRGPYDLKSDRVTMAEFADTLSVIVQAPVSDQSALSGAFKMELRYSESPEMGERRNSEGDAADIFGAIREQLGLRLARRNIQVSTLIVKHVEKPTTN